MGRTQSTGATQVKRPPFAFPDTQPLNEYAEHGMTLRDYFAGQALVGLLAGRRPEVVFTNEDAAKSSYAVADAMLDAREQGK
jgi:hypothetical protein